MIRPSLVTRYILRELLGPSLLALSFWVFLFLMNAMFFIAKMAISRDLSFGLVATLLLYELPQVLVLTIPMAVLLGTLSGIGRLSADHEMVALQASGLSPWEMLRPVAALGILASFVSLGMFAVVQPRANFASRVLHGRILATSNLTSNLSPRSFFSEIPGVVLFVDDIRAGTEGRLDGVLIYQSQRDKGPDMLFLAREGDLRWGAEGAGSLEVDLRDGWCYVYRPAAPDSYRFFRFQTYHYPIPLPAYLKSLSTPPERTVQDMTTIDLLAERQAARQEKDPTLRTYRARAAELQLHRSLALPVAALLFALLALPLGMTRARSGKGSAFALSLAVFLVYYVMFTVGQEQAGQGKIPVPLGIWAANGVTALWAGVENRRLFAPSRDRSRWLASWGGRLRQALSALRRAFLRRSETAGAPSRGEGGRGAEARLVGRIDGYVLGLFLRVLTLALVAAYAMFAILELRDLVTGIFQNHQPLSLAVAYLRYFAPGNLRVILPLSCLIAATVTFTTLGRSGELTAMKAGGLSMRRAAVPVLVLTGLLCGLLFLIQDQIAPLTNQKAQEIKDRIQGKPPRTYGLSVHGRWAFGTGDRLYHYGLYDPDKQAFQRLEIFTLNRSERRIVGQRYASAATWNGKKWLLAEGWYRSFPAGDAVGEFSKYDAEEPVALDPPENFARREISLTVGSDLPDQMSLMELRRQIGLLDLSGFDTTRLRVAFYSKVSLPLTPLVMVMLGLPFAFQVGRRGSLYGIGVALVLVIVYWATFSIFNALGLETILPAFLAAWAPNVIYTLIAGCLMLYIRT